jgi:hypothetical protein
MEKDKFSHLLILQELRENNPDDLKIICAWTGNHLNCLVKPQNKKVTIMRKSVPAEYLDLIFHRHVSDL